MLNTSRGQPTSRRAQRLLTLGAGAAAAAVISVGCITAGDNPVAEAATTQAAPAAQQPVAAPAVLGASLKIEGSAREDRRSLQAGIAIEDGYLYLWGWGKCGALGYKTTCSDFATPDNIAPTLVSGLPQGSIVEATSGIYNFNAVDKNGYVWGWGSYSNRDGTGGGKTRSGTGASIPPARIRIGGAWNDTSKPYLGQDDPVKILSGTEMSGAAVTRDGYVYSWGGKNYGGVGQGDLSDLTSGSNNYGALQVTGLPNPAEPGNRPIQVEGGYTTYWVVLENGEVWYFGGSDLGSNMERPAQDQPQKYSRTGTTGGTSQSNGAAQQANRSVSLAPWFKEESPDEYIVQVHSGISFGAALLSTGRVLTWGLDGGWGAIGRDCGKQSDYPGSSSQRKAAYEACFYEPGPVDFSTLEVEPVIVSTSCSFTAVAALSEDGVLYGWGVPNRSYEGLPGALGDIDDYEYPIVSVFEGNGAVVILDTNVVKFQNGQGFVIWWDVWGKMWGQGWQENGQLGHHSGNWGRSGFYNETKRRWLWFTKPQYEDDCRYTHQTVNYGNQTSDEVLFRDSSFKYNGVTYNCKDLNKKKDDGTWLERFTFERWLAYLDCRDAGGDETTCTLST